MIKETYICHQKGCNKEVGHAYEHRYRFYCKEHFEKHIESQIWSLDDETKAFALIIFIILLSFLCFVLSKSRLLLFD